MNNSWINRWFIYPTVCDLCGARGCHRESLCSACLADLPRIKHCCATCGRSLSVDSDYCGKCLLVHLPGQRVVAAFAYSYPLDSLIKQFKYKQHIRLIAPLTNVLADQIQSRCNDLPEVMIPVPLHKHRLRSRGFNQSQLICSVLSSTLRLKIDADAVIRIRDTLPMYELDADQRSENIKGAFRLQRQCQYKSVAFIDDIITSGSTMNELAGLFLETGVKRVEFWALARAD